MPSPASPPFPLTPSPFDWKRNETVTSVPDRSASCSPVSAVQRGGVAQEDVSQVQRNTLGNAFRIEEYVPTFMPMYSVSS